MRSYEVLQTLSRYFPPLALMCVIFALSAQADLNSGLGAWDTALRKAAHMVEFGLLWWLWQRALAMPAAAAAIALGYAASDEWHQSFVDGRVGSARDWAIDAVGIVIAAALAGPARRLASREPPPPTA
jgi:VanZ family protein